MLKTLDIRRSQVSCAAVHSYTWTHLEWWRLKPNGGANIYKWDNQRAVFRGESGKQRVYGGGMLYYHNKTWHEEKEELSESVKAVKGSDYSFIDIKIA